MATQISYRALTTIFFQATDRVLVGLPGSAVAGTAGQTLSYLGDRIDMHLESARNAAGRTARDVENFLERGCRPWSSNPLNSSDELARESAKAEALIEVYESLLPALLQEYTGVEELHVGARSLSALIVDQLGDAVPALEEQTWSVRREAFGVAAVGIVRLALAFAKEAAELRAAEKVAAKAAAEKAEAEKREALEIARIAGELRKIDRKNERAAARRSARAGS